MLYNVLPKIGSTKRVQFLLISSVVLFFSNFFADVTYPESILDILDVYNVQAVRYVIRNPKNGSKIASKCNNVANIALKQL